MWDRIPVWTGPESAQNGSVAYGSGGKPAKVLGMSPANTGRAGAGGGRHAVKNAMGDALGAGLY